MKYELIRAYVYGSLWAIQAEKLAIIMDALAFRAAGGVFTDEEIRERVGVAASRPGAAGPAVGGVHPARSGVQVIPVYGTLAHRADMLVESSGGTSTERLARAFRAAVADPQVGAIVLEMDSPGGMADGIPELGDEIYRARGQKPVVAVANTLAASAAYWLATQASELFVSPSAEVGSIGVISGHQDLSAAYDKAGVKTSLISAGKYKTEGNPFEPLTEEGRAAMQARVDDLYGMFVRAVARGRSTTSEAVRAGFGEGRVVGAREAVALGMADRVGTLDDAVARAAQLARGAAREARRAQDLGLRLRMAGL